jgi:hypothetical protein
VVVRVAGSDVGRLDYRGIAWANGLQLKGLVGTPYVTGLSTAAGHLVSNNGSPDTPDHLFYYGNNLNYGTDVANAQWRLVWRLDESGPSVLAVADTSGNLAIRGALTVAGTNDANSAPTVGPSVSSGAFDPEGTVTAPAGSMFMRTNGGVGTSLYVKESGSGFNGWAAK